MGLTACDVCKRRTHNMEKHVGTFDHAGQVARAEVDRVVAALLDEGWEKGGSFWNVLARAEVRGLPMIEAATTWNVSRDDQGRHYSDCLLSKWYPAWAVALAGATHVWPSAATRANKIIEAMTDQQARAAYSSAARLKSRP